MKSSVKILIENQDIDRLTKLIISATDNPLTSVEKLLYIIEQCYSFNEKFKRWNALVIMCDNFAIDNCEDPYYNFMSFYNRENT